MLRVPLYRKNTGNVNFQNTCFIAVVANLRHVLQPVMKAVRQYRWKDYVTHVRTSWHGEYSCGPGHNGQHDAAELLGDILHDHTSRCGVELCVTKQVFECIHCAERLECLPMLVLSLPHQEGRFTLRALQDNYFAPVEVDELQFEECGCLNATGLCAHTHLPEKPIWKIDISYQSI